MSETPPATRCRRATATDLGWIETVLAASDLPHRDIRAEPGQFYVLESAAGTGEGLVGAGGIELYESVGLLRSIVVEASARGNGLGVAICETLEEEARAAGIERLYLLTTTAREFFAARGYEVIHRDDAPAAIRETSEFAELCPADATCMMESL